MINSSYSLVLALALASACSKDQPKDPPKTETPKPQTADKAGSGDKTVAPGPKSIDGTYELDPSHSSVNFKIKHFDVSYTFGRFNKVTGSFTIDADPAKSKIAIEIDPASVYTADKKRDDHLKSPDFFNVAQYPKATFTSTAIKAVGADYQVTGDLEIHGTKKSVSTTFQLVGSGPHPMVPGAAAGRLHRRARDQAHRVRHVQHDRRRGRRRAADDLDRRSEEVACWSRRSSTRS